VSDLAAEAMSLRDNEAFQAALNAIRNGAVETLIAVNADDKNSLLKAQATVQVVDDIRDNLRAFIDAGKPKTLRAIP
jgi:hypothetical protein